MGDRNLVVRALVGMTLTTAAALGLYWWYFNRRNKRAGDLIDNQVPVKGETDGFHLNTGNTKIIEVPVTNRDPAVLEEALATANDSKGQNGGLVSKPDDKHLTEELIIPKDVVAGIIGKKGTHIKQIQKDSNTRINFKDESKYKE